MTWINFEDEFFNLNDFSHIWINKDENDKYYAMGEWRHNVDEIVISKSYENKNDLVEYLFDKMNLGEK